MTGEIDIPYDHTVSRRFFHYTDHGMEWWRVIDLTGIRGGDENCNRTIGIKWGRGEWLMCLNVPLRQKPCRVCRHELWTNDVSVL